MLTVILLSALVVRCWSDMTCQDALGKYCSKDMKTVCHQCPFTFLFQQFVQRISWDRGSGICNAEDVCASSSDPILCFTNLMKADRCAWPLYPCDKDTTWFSYGCYKKRCYSQCVGMANGRKEWCYLAKRQPGPIVDYKCTKNSDCEPRKLKSFQCSGICQNL